MSQEATIASGKANAQAPPSLTHRRTSKIEAEETLEQPVLQEKLPTLLDTAKWAKDNPHEVLTRILDNRTLLRRLAIVIFSLASISLSSLLLSDSQYRITTWVFLKLYGAVYLAAFYGLYIQSDGLVGPRGIAPISDTMDSLGQYFNMTRTKRGPAGESSWYGPIDAQLSRFSCWNSLKLLAQKYFMAPTLFWLSSNPDMLPGLFKLGMAASTLLILGIGPAPLLIATMYLVYLSFMQVFDEFLALQWDVLLLESAFASMLLSLSSHGFAMFHILPSQTGEPSRFALFAFWWLVFRLMFASGVVKLTSRDKTWADLTAMTFHYRTQPLPSSSSHFMHNLPLWFHKMETLGTFGIELVLPLLVFGNSMMRFAATVSFIFLNAMISTTGNYGFFNVLTIVLSLLLIDDNIWTLHWFAVTPWSWPNLVWADILIIPFYTMGALCSGQLMNRAFRTKIFDVPMWIANAHKSISSWYLLSSYGLFAIMTTKRIELVIEGSADGESWKEYDFKYKPGNLKRAPKNHPLHLPRLDWRMWFCAFNKYPNIPDWFTKLLTEIGAGNPNVLALLEYAPFDQENPPTYLRVRRYDYYFTTPDVLKETGAWWWREDKGELFPQMIKIGREDT